MSALDMAAADLMEGRLTDPFGLLGPHDTGEGRVVRTFQPGADAVEVVARNNGRLLGILEPQHGGLFAGKVSGPEPYLLRIRWPGAVQETEDAYSFGLVLGELDLHLFNEGRHWDLGRRMGAQPTTLEGVEGVAFSVWAPDARRVSVVGDFNTWDGRRHPMRLRHGAGVWELFVPRLGSGARYKFEVVGADGVARQKADPLARATEPPPATGSIVAAPPDFAWTDADWMASRRQGPDRPMSIYEVHAGSWLRQDGDDSPVLDWAALSDKLVGYVADMGFTHVELLPIMEHPFGGSWGYQPLSQFAPSARYGSPEDFARFVDACHRHGVGVILDWVPAHFPTDAHGLAQFDGTALYEHADPREGFHQDWNTLIYNLGRREVAGFLIASGLWWLETFHVDGLRVDAVASMLYRDYSRKAGEWVPNQFGGRENLESIDFLRRLNTLVAERCPGAVTLAEESTAWPGVSAPVSEGGLGFTYKWNMGWMHDTLSYMEQDPIYRSWRHNELTFGLVYAFSERFVLPPVPRRGGARQRVADRQDARRSVAEDGQPAGLSRLHVDPSGQEAAVHGRRNRPGAGVEPRPRAGLGSARQSRPCGAAEAGAGAEPALCRRAGPAPQRRGPCRLSLDRRRRPGQQRVRLPANDARRADPAGGGEHDAGAAFRLPRRRSVSGQVARGVEYRCAGLRGRERRLGRGR